MTIKRALTIGVSALAILAAAAQANAADMGSAPSTGGYKDGPGYIGVNWSGLYLGAHVGGAWSDLQLTEANNWGGPHGYAWNNNPSHVFGGCQIGYNLQRDRLVFGIEADLGYMLLAKKSLEVADPISEGCSKVGGGLYADVTGRLGVTLDRALIYAKGGYAYFGGDIGYETPAWNASVSQSGLSGWTYGGGVEYKLNPSWSLKAEYLHFDFGTGTLVLHPGPGLTEPFPSKFAMDSVKAGINYFVVPGYEPLK